MSLKIKFAPIALGLSLLLTGSAIAQENAGTAVPKEAQSTKPTAPRRATPDATTPPPSQQATSGAPPPTTSVVGNYGEWVLVCANVKDASGKKRCSLVQALVEQQSKKLAFRVIFTHGPQNNLVLQIDGPIGVALQRGLEFSPDTKKIYRLPFQTCVPRGCRAVMVVDDDLKGELKTSKKGSLTVFALNGQAVRTATDLSGLSEGLAALDERQAPKSKTSKR